MWRASSPAEYSRDSAYSMPRPRNVERAGPLAAKRPCRACVRRPHTKLFQAERERLTLVVADTAPSLYFGTRVRFNWQVFADKPLLRVLTPLLRPAFRWNHAWAIARAREGLEPFARA